MACKDRYMNMKTKQRQEITTAPVPPDGGWGWIVVIATGYFAALVDGTYSTFGILFVHFRENFGETTATTSWAGSVLGGTSFSSGVLASALASRYSFRRIAIGGSLLAAFSLFVSSFSPNIGTLIFFYGFMTGGFMTQDIHDLYHKWLQGVSLVILLSCAIFFSPECSQFGSYIACSVMSSINSYIGAGLGFMFLSSLVMVGYYFKERRALATSIALCGSGIGNIVFAPFTEYLIDMYGWRGALWIVAGVVSHGAVFGALLRPLKPIVTNVRPTDESQEVLLLEASPITNSASSAHNGEVLKSQNDNVSTVTMTSPESRVPSEVEQQNLNIQMKDRGASLLWSEFNDAPSPRNRCMTQDPSTLRKPNWTNNHNLPLGSLDVTRRLHRKDILYSGSLHHIPQYTSHSSVNKYAESVTPVADEGNTKMTRCFQWLYILKLARDYLTNMLDWSLLTNITFVIYLASCFFSTMVIYVPLSFFPTMAMEIGSDSQHAALLLSVLGITNCLGRIPVGILCDRPWVDILLVNNIGLILAGIATMALPLYQTYGLMVTYCAFYGILISPFLGLRVVIAVELVGLDKLTSALGFITMAQGVGLLLGIPMTGALRDATRTFDASLYVSGLILILCGTMSLPLRRVKKWETTRNERQSENAKKTNATI